MEGLKLPKKMIRCYECKHFKPVGRGYSGWCQDAKPKVKVQAVDFCPHAEKKEVD